MGYITLAFSGAHKRAELLLPPPLQTPTPCNPPPPPGDRHSQIPCIAFPLLQIKHLCVFCDILSPKALYGCVVLLLQTHGGGSQPMCDPEGCSTVWGAVGGGGGTPLRRGGDQWSVPID